MNIEKSMVFSYLRHIKKCKIIQTEWFPSTESWNIHSRKGEELLRIAKNYFRNKYRIALFEDIMTLNDLNKNDIIDAFGISFNEDYTEKIYGVSSYIYREYDELNVKYVLEKIFLMAIYFISCFNKIEGNIIFLCSCADFELIKKLASFYEDIKEVFVQIKCEFEVNVYLNEQFNEEVLEKVNTVVEKNIDIGDNEEYIKYRRFSNNIHGFDNRILSGEDNRGNKTDNDQINEEESYIELESRIDNKSIEVDAVKADNQAEINIEDEEILVNEEKVNEHQPKKIDMVIDDDTEKLLSYNQSDKDDSYDNSNHTTSYYMNKHNVKTQFSVDSNSFNKILEERKKRIVKELLESKTNRNLNEKYADIKISELVKNELNRLFEMEKIPRGEIRKLQEREYSMNTFGIDYPVLKEVNLNESLEEQRRDKNGTAIYYGFISTIYDKDYYICSAWSEEHRIKFLRYLSFFK